MADETSRVFAEFFDYPSLVAALRQCREHRGISMKRSTISVGFQKDMRAKFWLLGVRDE